ncbi:helix-turn-helix domain-containing protein [Longispora fulva]|uniref:Transcriptional regulator with XRE-family HTH domain n=2 Tax=Longispora fulva TaxID=619741 RepID=A0A8J7KZI6_9ACTN|nr:helix-turn-helix transcriptional regulator [Longispora fulva]MBG6141107.1 transcriptional regulator with XRE-family HTH domain [Longispora fulva]
MLTLAELIAEYQQRHSPEALTATLGGDVKGLRKLRDGENTEFPLPATIRALADALGVTQLGAVRATAQGVGIDMGLAETPWRTLAAELPPEVDEIPDALLGAILDLAWELVAVGLGVARYEPAPPPYGAHPPPTLAALIATLRAGRTLAEIAREVGVNSPTTVHRLAKGENSEFPRVATIKGLARALDVAPREIVLATAASLGFPVYEGPQSEWARRLPPEVDELPEPSREAIRAAVRAALSLTYGTPTHKAPDNVRSILDRLGKP